MKRWEYTTAPMVSLNRPSLIGTFDPEVQISHDGWRNLNELGALGWELCGVSIAKNDMGRDCEVAIFKRELPREHEV